MREIDLALSEISSIRAQLLAATRFRGISPGFNLVLGVAVVVLTLFQSVTAPAATELEFVVQWAGVLLGCTAVTAIGAISRSRRLHGQLSAAMLGSVMQKIAPFVLAAVMISYVLCAFAVDSIRLLPGLWLVLIGLLGYSLLPAVPRQLFWVAGWYLLSGIIFLYLAGVTEALQPWMIGVPLAGGFLLVASILKRGGA